MAHGFDDYRAFISAPGDLDADRACCREVLSHVNEITTVPAKVLLVPVGLRDNEQISGYRGIVFDNLRWSSVGRQREIALLRLIFTEEACERHPVPYPESMFTVEQG